MIRRFKSCNQLIFSNNCLFEYFSLINSVTLAYIIRESDDDVQTSKHCSSAIRYEYF
jgi:hypothetical protein